MRVLPLAPIAVLLVLVTGCNRNDEARPADSTPAADATPAAATTGDAAAVTMRYACDGDTNVEVLGADRARAALPDGHTVDMTRVADSMPPVFAGGSLYFAIGSTDAHLSQEDGKNELTCNPQ